MPKQLLFFFSCFFVTAGASFGQDSATENHFVKDAESNAVDAYYRFTDKRARLYNGTEHIGYLYNIKGFAYYVQNTWDKGSVFYDGLLFEQVPMLYDLYQDVVVILHFNGYRLNLLSERVKEFNLLDHHFVRYVYDSMAPPLSTVPVTGFYDQLYEGKIMVLAKRQKLLDEKLTDVVEYEFLPKTSFYIYKDSVYHSCKTYRGLRNALSDKSKDVRRYLRKNKIKFKDNPEYAIVQAAKYYDTLK
jgi:hypothetical protein